MNQTCWTAFAGFTCIASGDPRDVAVAVKEAEASAAGHPAILVFDDSGRQVELDLRGTVEDVRRRLCDSRASDAGWRASDAGLPAGGPAQPAAAVRGPGRPKLGVVAREVTLLPRHWEWLNGQPGGASVALRRLVEAARRGQEGSDRDRRAQEAAYRFMHAIAGNLAGFEEAARALFARDRTRFAATLEAWPADVGAYAAKLAAGAFSEAAPGG